MIILGEKNKLSILERRIIRRKTKRLISLKTAGVADSVVIAELTRLLEKTPSTIAMNLSGEPSAEMTQFLTRLELEGVNFIKFETLVETYLKKCFIPESDAELAYLHAVRKFPLWIAAIKRAEDIIGAIFLIAITSPLWIYAARRIKRESPGSVFFKQERVGRGGKSFVCYKFRSMRPESEFDPYTRKNDGRVFPWGATMRRLRIDELPQLLNVLKGDMSLVGPRAEWKLLVEGYEKSIAFYNERHLVRPGITGWAQVNYRYGSNIKDTRQKLMFDLYYIKRWSPLLELETILGTLWVVAKRKGV